MILGIDEVGRGPWAGPLVVGAVVLGGATIDGLTDSKKLSRKRRDELDEMIRLNAQAIGLGWVSAHELDEVGMSEALRLATRRAVEQIKVPYHEIVIDGTINLLTGTGKEQYVTTLPKADLLVPSVSAASIVAKVARDRYMIEQDKKYPQYGFGKHAGYGVAAHREAIANYGVCPLHRLSFAPLAQYRSVEPLVPETTSINHISTRQIGNESEEATARYLVGTGHQIIERNWRTKYCEIDIVSRYDSTIVFTEVKHRKNAEYGDGFDAITQEKLCQMQFAARLYATNAIAKDCDLKLAVAQTSGTPPKLIDYLELE